MDAYLSVDKNLARVQTLVMRLRVICLMTTALLSLPSLAQVPVYQVTPVQSSIRFNVRSSKPLTGNFEKWTATLTFSSRDATSGMLNVEIQAASVNGKMEGELKSKDFLNVEQCPTISFKTTKVVQTGKTTFDVAGMFTMRGVSKPATLNLVIADRDVGSGYAQGTLSFDRKDFGIPSNRRGDDTVEVNVILKVEQVSGPPLVRKTYR